MKKALFTMFLCTFLVLIQPIDVKANDKENDTEETTDTGFEFNLDTTDTELEFDSDIITKEHTEIYNNRTYKDISKNSALKAINDDSYPYNGVLMIDISKLFQFEDDITYEFKVYSKGYTIIDERYGKSPYPCLKVPVSSYVKEYKLNGATINASEIFTGITLKDLEKLQEQGDVSIIFETKDSAGNLVVYEIKMPESSAIWWHIYAPSLLMLLGIIIFFILICFCFDNFKKKKPKNNDDVKAEIWTIYKSMENLMKYDVGDRLILKHTNKGKTIDKIEIKILNIEKDIPIKKEENTNKE